MGRVNSSDLVLLSDRRRREAIRIIRQSGVVEAWESVGATVNLVGSVRSGLIMKNLDIDFHIYTDEPMLEKSLAAMELLKKNQSICNIQYRNLLDVEEECIEWHAWYEDDAGACDAIVARSEGEEYGAGMVWQLDMIHIRRGSRFDGIIEQATDAVIARLRPETREAILRIKHDAPDGIKTPGIEVYYAVISLGIQTYEEFAAWRRANPDIDLLGWKP